MVIIHNEEQSTSPTQNLNLEELTPTQLFDFVIHEAGKRVGFNVTSKHEGWLVEFSDPTTNEVKHVLLGYDFGLNNSQAYSIAKDKFLTSRFLTSNNVLHVEHYLMSDTSNYQDLTPKEVMEEFRQTHDFPMVIKQSNGGGGKNIYFAFNEFDFVNAIALLTKKGVQIALSPYYDFNIEYRCTVLNGKVLMGYGKTKGENHQNNLSKGARVVDVPDTIKDQLYDLAIKTNEALNLNFTNVDIIDTPQGLRVLEVNGTVALKRVLKAGHKYIDQAIEVYAQALKALSNKD